MIPQTESWFTNTGRGLLTILMVGTAYQVLDIQLLTSTIKIPGLPEININNVQGFQTLFLCFLVYAIYRYILHNAEALKMVMNKALALHIGTDPNRRLFFNVFDSATIICSYAEGGSAVSNDGYVFVDAYPSGRGNHGHYIRYYLALQDWSTIAVYVSSEGGVVNQIEGAIEKQGIKRDDFNFTYQKTSELSKTSLNGSFNRGLVIGAYLFFLIASFRDKTSFDTSFPLISCIVLALYLSGKLMCATFGA